MRKEVVLAISIGLILGLIITFGVYTANQATKGPSSSTINPTPTPAASPSPASQNVLIERVTPQDGDIFNSAEATISGQIKPNTHLIILSENEDLVVTPDDNLQFNQTVKLVSGANLIRLVAISGDQKQEITLNLVFTTTKYE